MEDDNAIACIDVVVETPQKDMPKEMKVERKARRARKRERREREKSIERDIYIYIFIESNSRVLIGQELWMKSSNPFGSCPNLRHIRHYGVIWSYIENYTTL